MDENNNKNLILATVLSFLVIMVWFLLFPPPEPAPAPEAPAATAPVAGTTPPTAAGTSATAATASVVEAPRVTIDTPVLSGSISLLGGRIDDLSLKGYRQTLAADSPVVQLLSPAGTSQPFYALFGWSPADC